MTFLEQLQTLDRRDIGRWPMPFRLGLIARLSGRPLELV